MKTLIITLRLMVESMKEIIEPFHVLIKRDFMNFGLYHPVSVRRHGIRNRNYANMGADEERRVYKEEVEVQTRVNRFRLNAKNTRVLQCQAESQAGFWVE